MADKTKGQVKLLHSSPGMEAKPGNSQASSSQICAAFPLKPKTLPANCESCCLRYHTKAGKHSSSIIEGLITAIVIELVQSLRRDDSQG